MYYIIKINNTTVPFSIFTKFFGIHVDNNLNWNAHTKHINKKNSKGVGVLFCLRIELPHKILLLIYNTLVLPYLLLHYLGVYVQIGYKFFNYPGKDLYIIFNSPTYSHTSPILKNLGLLNIIQHIQYHALIFMFQQRINLLPIFYEEKFIIASKYHTYNTCYSKCLRSTFVKLDISKNSQCTFIYNVFKAWHIITVIHRYVCICIYSANIKHSCDTLVQ